MPILTVRQKHDGEMIGVNDNKTLIISRNIKRIYKYANEKRMMVRLLKKEKTAKKVAWYGWDY